MKKILYIYLLAQFVLLNNLQAQNNNIINFGVPGSYTGSTDGYIDNQGNIIAIFNTDLGVAIGSFNAHYTANWTKFIAPWSTTIDKIFSLSNGDFVACIVQENSVGSHILKFDSQGNIHWHKKIQGPPAANLHKILELNGNKIALIGINATNSLYTVFDFNGNLEHSKAISSPTNPIVIPREILDTQDGNHLVASQLVGNGTPKILLSKLTPTGTVVWEKTHNFPYTVTFNSGVRSNDGNIYLVGNYNSSLIPGDLNSRDLLILKFSENGDFLLGKTYGNQYEEDGYDIQEAEDGSLVVIGMLKPVQNCSGNLLVVNVDSNLDTLYTKTYGTLVGEGAFFYRLHNNGSEFYSFGNGSLWTNIGTIGDAHLVRTDKHFELDCYKFNSGLDNIGTINSTLITTDALHTVSTPNFINYSQNTATSFTVADGCNGTILSLDEQLKKTKKINLFPVPAEDVVNILARNTLFEYIEIYDLTGKLVLKNQLNATDYSTVEIHLLNSGIYIAKIGCKDGIYSERIIKR
ncbi:MAG: T9SS type A sorting domain-containing protein [Flavobacteriales bacterium]